MNRAIEYEIVEKCKVPIIVYSPLAQGLLGGKIRALEDCSEGLSRSRFFHNSRSKLCRHKEEGAEKELFESISKIRQISERLGQPMASVSLAWVLQQKGVGAVLVGASSSQQVKSNVEALSLKLDQETIKELSEASRPLKEKMGSNPDLWWPVSRYA